jgi:hypothetical protein
MLFGSTTLAASFARDRVDCPVVDERKVARVPVVV